MLSSLANCYFDLVHPQSSLHIFTLFISKSCLRVLFLALAPRIPWFGSIASFLPVRVARIGGGHCGQRRSKTDDFYQIISLRIWNHDKSCACILLMGMMGDVS